MSGSFTILRAEGWRAACERALDRADDRRRASAYLEVSPATLQAGARGKVTVLNVLGVPLRRNHGGVTLQFLARQAVEQARRATACLVPQGGRWVLEVSLLAGRRMRAVFERRPTETPGQFFAHALQSALDLIGPAAVHVENPAGLPTETLIDTPAPLLLSLHDSSLWCPRPFELPMTADGACGWSPEGGCARCAGAERTPDAVRALLSRLRGLVVPPGYLAAELERRTGAPIPTQVHLVSPAVRLPPARPWRSAAPVSRISYVGSVDVHKGGETLLALAPLLRDAGYAVRAYGGGESSLVRRVRAAGVETLGYYRAGSLSRRLVRDRVDLALLLSTWPETHSLTLDECWAAGIPAIAFDRGALGARLRSGGGVAVAPESGVEGLAEAIRGIARDGTTRPPAEPPSTPDIAATRVLEIYRDLGWWR
jgi:glycosyltransferase involved in cell wall biosynthesis